MRGIITADWHIRPDRPRCRKDEDWEQFQICSIRKIVAIANSRGCPLYIIGDIYEKAVVPERLVIMVIRELSMVRHDVYIVPGNHDLPYHSIDNIDDSSIGVINALIDKYKFNTPSEAGCVFEHRLVFPDSKSIPHGVDAPTAAELLDEYDSSIKWVFTGDMHGGFHYRSKRGRHVVNPGCINRQSADEAKYAPGVYYVDTSKDQVDRIELDDDSELIDDTYIAQEEERDSRIAAFVEKINKGKSIGLSFIDNVRSAMAANVLGSGVKKEIESLLEEAVNDKH